jgi:hypothetical protein
VGALGVAALAFGCHSNALSGDWAVDDPKAFLWNPDVVGVNGSMGPFSDLLHHDYWGEDIRDWKSHKSYRPLTVASFRLSFFLSGGEKQSTVPYHIENIGLHAAVTVLLLCLCRRLLPAQPAVGLGAAALFATLAVHVEAVVNITGRAELLSAPARGRLRALSAYHRRSILYFDVYGRVAAYRPL